MERHTVNLPAKRIFAQLDKLRGCYECQDKKGCDRYSFVNDATQAIIEENGFENSFMGQVIARNLSWAFADEAMLSEIAIEADEEYLESDNNSLFYMLESTREHIRELMKIIMEMKK
jgi:hypothetical protein